MRKINKHIIHCSDSEFGDAKIIREWHKARGWDDVGYHFIIRTDGEIEIGRTLDVVGAHCYGHNKTSVGTCLIGTDTFSEEQFESLNRLNNMLKSLFKGIEAFPHNFFDKEKSCPNFDIKRVLKDD